jgi:glycosyltransferase involved in cell wall biosynthesis
MQVYFDVLYYHYPKKREVRESSACEVRIKPLITELKKHGVTAVITKKPPPNSFNPLQRYILPYNPRDLLSIGDLVASEVLFASRTTYLGTYWLQKIWRKLGKPLIFDFDDALFLHPAIRFGLLPKTLRQSSAVTVSSHFLLSYAKSLNPNSHLIQTPIDSDFFLPTLRFPRKKVTIGWMGNPTDHWRNLQILKPVLIRLGKKHDVRFKLVSSLGNPHVLETFREVEQYMEVDYGLDHTVPYYQLPEQLLDFDIGVSPLLNAPWFEAKSAIKTAMYMAMGVPTVASYAGEQKYVLAKGTAGFLAKTEDDWFNYLNLLVEDSKLRRQMGAAARKHAEAELSVRAVGKKLYDVLAALR